MKKFDISSFITGIVIGVVIVVMFHIKIITVGPMGKGTLADWLSAAGTFLAVVVSLYFSRSWNKNYVRFYIEDNDMLVINNLSTYEVALKIVRGSEMLEYNSKSLVRLRPVNITEEVRIRSFEELGPTTRRLDCEKIQLNEQMNGGVIIFHEEVRNVLFKIKIVKEQNRFRVKKQGHTTKLVLLVSKIKNQLCDCSCDSK